MSFGFLTYLKIRGSFVFLIIYNSEKSIFWRSSILKRCNLEYHLSDRQKFGKLKYRLIEIPKIFGSLDRSKNRKTNILMCQNLTLWIKIPKIVILMVGNNENQNSCGSKYRKLKICLANNFLPFCTIKMLNKDK